MRDRFFYSIGIAFVGGVGFGSVISWGWEGVVLFLGIGALCIFLWYMSREGEAHASPLVLCGVCLIAFGCGMLRLHLSDAQDSSLKIYENEDVVLHARIVREPEIRASQIHLAVSPTDAALQDEIILVTLDRLTHSALDLSYGDQVEVEGTLKLPEAFATDGGRVFDYPGFLRARGITHTIPFADVSITQEESGTFFGMLFRAKHVFMEAIETSIREPYAGLGEGVLLGVKRAIGEKLEDTFRETGIIHIVVLSGYNIMLVVTFVMYLLSFGFYPRMRLVIGLGSIVLFAVLVGLSATVVRASIMAGLLLVAQTTGNTYAVLRALILAGVVMLLLNPYLLVHDPGFQLSFLASLGLILCAPWVEKRVTRIPEFWGLRNIGIATIIAQLFVLPLLLYKMGLLSVVSVVVNILVLPMVPVAMLLTFATGLVTLVSETLGMGVGFLAYLSLKYIVVVAELFAALPFASFTLDGFPLWVMVLMYLVLGGIVAWLLLRDDTEILEETVTNDYEGWVIEEEGTLKKLGSEEEKMEVLEKKTENQKDPLPFR